MNAPYADAARRYLEAGWSPIPVGNDPGEQAPPATGFTGGNGAYPDPDQVEAWVREKGRLNIGLRLAPGIVGVDVDQYWKDGRQKNGATQLAEIEAAHGPIPPTWTSTSRGADTPSRIHLFRYTIDAALHDPAGDIEAIWWKHRYAVVWPSYRADLDGAAYTWYRPDRSPADPGEVPRPDELAELPLEWQQHLAEECSCVAKGEAERAPLKLEVGSDRDPVRRLEAEWEEGMTLGGRHDITNRKVMALVAADLGGWPGARDTIDRIRSRFVDAVAESRGGQRAAEDEFDRMVTGAEAKATPWTQWEQAPPNTGTTSQPPVDASPDQLEEHILRELQTLRVRDEARRRHRAEQRPPAAPPEILTLAERLARPQPDTRWVIEGWQPQGARTVLAAQFKAGKTTLVGNIARCLADREPWLGVAHVNPPEGPTAVLDFEMNDRQLDDWYRDLNIRHPDRVILIPMRGRTLGFDILDDTTRDQWVQRLKGVGYLIIDPLGPILAALGIDPNNDVGRFLVAYDQLLLEAGIPNSLLVHHMGHGAERPKGDSTIRAWPDVEWQLKRENESPASNRYIEAYGRDVHIPEAAIAHDTGNRRLVLLGGSRKNAAARGALVDILELLADGEKRSKSAIETAIVDATDHTRQTIRDGLAAGVKDERIAVEPGARNAKLHYLAPPVRQLAGVRRQFAGEVGSEFASSPIEGELLNNSHRTFFGDQFANGEHHHKTEPAR